MAVQKAPTDSVENTTSTSSERDNNNAVGTRRFMFVSVIGVHGLSELSQFDDADLPYASAPARTSRLPEDPSASAARYLGHAVAMGILRMGIAPSHVADLIIDDQIPAVVAIAVTAAAHVGGNDAST
jgi:hypothetical protein